MSFPLPLPHFDEHQKVRIVQLCLVVRVRSLQIVIVRWSDRENAKIATVDLVAVDSEANVTRHQSLPQLRINPWVIGGWSNGRPSKVTSKARPDST